MADNVTANAGSGGAVFATDEISTVHYPRSKVVWGPDGTANDTAAASGKGLPIQGEAAHDAVTTGNPVLLGAEARTTAPTAVGSGDAVRLQADTLGKLVVLPGAVHDRHVNGYTATALTGTSASDVIAAQGAGIRIVVTSILVTNAHASVGTKVEIRDGTTVKYRGWAAAGGGFAVCPGVPILIGSANAAITARCVTTGADVDVSISGYTITN